MVLERCRPSLRGVLTRWLLEIRPNVFVGRVSARIRDMLWQRATDKNPDGSVVQVWSTRSEQGFEFRLHGDPTYLPRDFEGLCLITRPSRSKPGGASSGIREDSEM